MTLAEVADVVGGRLDGTDGTPRVTAPAVVDSREVVEGSLFAAFAGEHVDGHRYAAAAVAAGAAGVLASRPVDAPAVLVPDVQEALGRLAHHLVGRLPELRVTAVTGSQGKTSTKDLLAAVLADAAPTVATHGSFNNELGLPLTVLRATAETRHLLLEMGARGVGHLRLLCAVARPDVSLVLNVGKAHLGEFGSVEAIATAKGELVEALDDDGTAVLNADDPLVLAMAARTGARVLTFGRSPAADVRLGGVRLDSGGRPRFSLAHQGRSAEVALQLVGEHQAANAAAATAAAVAAEVPFDAAVDSLTRVASLSRWRMEVTELPGRVTLVNDSYNANPDSTAAALRALVAIAGGEPERPRRSVAVLGEMRELGESGTAEHEAVGRLAVRLGVDRLLAVGEAARAVHEGARAERRGHGSGESELVADNDEAVAWLAAHLRRGDVVLVKASRGARLDLVADAVARRAAQEAGR